MHFLQIWIEPNQYGMKPSYEQKHFSAERKEGPAAPDRFAGRRATARCSMHQDARVYASVLDADDAVGYALPAGRKAYVHVARGKSA